MTRFCYFNWLISPRWNPILKNAIAPSLIFFTLALGGTEVRAELIITQVGGEITQFDASRNISYPALKGGILNISLGKQLKGEGELTVICSADGRSHKIRSPSVIQVDCLSTPTMDTVFRTGNENDAPLIFYPPAGKIHRLEHVVWGSKVSGLFEVKIDIQTDSGFKPVFHSGEIRSRSRYVKQNMTFHYLIPTEIVQTLTPGSVYQITVKNIRNGRTNAESAMPGGMVEIDKSSQVTGLHIPKGIQAIAAKEVRQLISAFYFMTRDEPVESLGLLDQFKHKNLLPQILLAKAHSVRRMNAPFDYSAAFYLASLKAAVSQGDKGDVTARLSCIALQEDIFSMPSHWKSQIKLLKSDASYRKHCQ